MIPPTAVSVMGATITVGNATYQVVGVEQLFEQGVCYGQKADLS
jgi:hypothetical protein